MVNIEINGIAVQARPGAMVIEAADEAGIVIPRFCYHKKLSIAASCRMCLVEVEKVAKPLPACATPVSEGMKVFTRSPKALGAQKAVMEFLLVNHPLDCPICDQGGECALQEMAMGFGGDQSRYGEAKRVVPQNDLGPLIATDMARCIHCTRCVRFGQEIAGIMELGATGRGEHTRIGTYVERSVESELSGNVIDLCPVGALTSKPYRYTARPWELSARDSVAPHDCVGANLKVETRSGKVMRVVPRENEAVNETWLADRDRFSYMALAHGDRLTAPQIKRNGRWETVGWDQALTYAAEQLKKVVAQHGAGQVGGLGAYWATTEELYLLQRLLRGIGSGNVDYRVRQQDFSDQAEQPPFPYLGTALTALNDMGAVLLVGSNVRKEQPLIGHRLRQATLAGCRVSAINPVDFPFNFTLAARRVAAPARMVGELAAVAKVLLESSGQKAPDGFELVKGVEVTDDHRAMAESLRQAERAVVLLGNLTQAHPQRATLHALATLVATLAGATVGVIAEGGNAAGAALAGALPHRGAGGVAAAVTGRDWLDMARAGLKGWVVLGLEPEADALDGSLLRQALQGAEQTVMLTAFATEAMREYATVLLPIALFPETSGSFVNGEGRWQSFAGCCPAPGDARPAWKVLRVLGNLLGVDGFDYLSSEEVLGEVKAACDGVAASGAVAWRRPAAVAAEPEGLQRIADFPLYAADPMVRRSAALQATSDSRARQAVALSGATAARAGVGGAERVAVCQGTEEAILPLRLDETVPTGCVLIGAGLPGGLGAGTGFAAVALSKA